MEPRTKQSAVRIAIVCATAGCILTAVPGMQIATSAQSNVLVYPQPIATPILDDDVALPPKKATSSTARSTARRLGSFQFTYYWVAEQSRRETGPSRTLRNKKCRPIATVPRSFAKRLQMEGSGRLLDGRLVNVAGHCQCGTICYAVMSDSAPWGVGSRNNPLAPFRSVAVDTKWVSRGQPLYIPELDGKVMPGQSPWGGFVHDGCVVAADVGGNIAGRQIDFFTGNKSHYRAIKQQHALRRVTVLDGTNLCSVEKNNVKPVATKSTVASVHSHRKAIAQAIAIDSYNMYEHVTKSVIEFFW